MTDIQLINDNGVIKGIDPETGEEVSVEMQDLGVQSIDTDEVNNETIFLDTPVTQQKLRAAQDDLADNYGGGEIVVPEGVWEDRWALTRDYITLRGRSWQSTLKLPDGVNEPAQTLTVTGNNCTVELLTCDGNKYNQDVSGYSKSALSDGDAIGVYGDDCIIRNCHALQSMSHGIIAWGREDTDGAANADTSNASGNGVRIIGNTVEDNGVSNNVRAMIDCAFGPQDLFIARNVTIPGTNSENAITLHTATDAVVTQNILDSSKNGVTPHTNSDRVTVTNNLITATKTGIYHDNSSGLTARGNIIRDVDIGVNVVGGATEAAICGNVIENTDRTGVELLDGHQNTTISDNTFKGIGKHAITALDTGSLVSIRGNLFKDQFQRGVHLRHSVSGVTIADNLFSGTGVNNGVYADESVTKLSVSGNIFRGGQSIYIPATGTIDGVISDNVFEITAGDYMVDINGGASNIKISDNIFREEGTSSLTATINSNPSDKVTLVDNVFRGDVSLSVSTDTTDWIQRSNEGIDDHLSAVPYSSPSAGDWYLDDGTNTGSGTRGKRVYDGTAWADAWTV